MNEYREIEVSALHPKIGRKLDVINLRKNINDEVREEIHEH